MSDDDNREDEATGGEQDASASESGEPPVPQSDSAPEGDGETTDASETPGTEGAEGSAQPGATGTPGGGDEQIDLVGEDDGRGPVQIPEGHEAQVPDDLRAEIEEIIARYPQVRSASLPALFAIQKRYGWCTPEGIRQAASVMGVSAAYLESVGSFYDLFHMEPAGKHRVLVCTNISCWMRGGDELLESFCEAAGADLEDAGHGGTVNADGDIFVSGFECLGACDIAPMASIDERYFGPLELAEAKTAIEQLRAGEQVLPDRALIERPAAGGPEPDPDPRVARVETSD